MTELFSREVETEGGWLHFQVTKEYGQTPRLTITNVPKAECLNDQVGATVCVFEEDFSAFLQGVMDAVASLGFVADPRRRLTEEERYSDIRKIFPNAYKPWSNAEDQQLLREHEDGIDVKDIGVNHGRKASAIASRLQKLIPNTIDFMDEKG